MRERAGPVARQSVAVNSDAVAGTPVTERRRVEWTRRAFAKRHGDPIAGKVGLRVYTGRVLNGRQRARCGADLHGRHHMAGWSRRTDIWTAKRDKQMWITLQD